MKTLIFLVLTGLSFGFMAYAVEEGLDGFGDCDSVFEDGENDIDEVHFRFHGNYEGADQEVIQRLVERSQDAFESGAFDLAAISFALEKKLFVVSRVKPADGNAFFSVSAKDLTHSPLNENQIRLSSHATSGGTQRQHYFSERSFKEQLARCPSYSTGKHYGAYLTTDSGQVEHHVGSIGFGFFRMARFSL